MNLQAHHLGKTTGHAPSQAGNSPSGPSLQSGSVLSNQAQNSNIHHKVPNMNPEIVKARRSVQSKIYEILMKRNQQSSELSTKKMVDIVKRLEEGLFKSALSTEEYRNMATLESRLHVLIKRTHMCNDNQQFSHVNSSPSIDTMIPTHAKSSPSIGSMIPTPGLSETGNSFPMSSSVESSLIASNSSNTIMSSNINTSSFFPTGYGSSGSVPNGALSSGCQQSTTVSVNSVGCKLVTSMSAQRNTSQMIPTPGYNHSSHDDLNTNPNNQSVLKLESSNNVSAYPSVDSSVVSQPIHQKPQDSCQNNCNLHSIEGHISSGIRSSFQQRSYGNITPINGSGNSEGYFSGTMCHNSKPLHGRFDQHRLSTEQGDGYGNGTADTSVFGNSYPLTSVGPTMSNEGLNAVSLQPIQITNFPMMANQHNRPHLSQQVKTTKQQSFDQSDKLSSSSQFAVDENPLQSHQQPQFQQQSNQFQHQQIVQNQPQLNQQNQNRLLLKKDAYGLYHLSSNIESEEKFQNEKEQHDEFLNSQVSKSFQFSDMHNQFEQNSVDEHSRATFSITTSDQMQDQRQFVADPQSDIGVLSDSIGHDAAFCSGWYSNSQNGPYESGKFQHNQNVQEEVFHGVSDQDLAGQTSLCSKESLMGLSDTSRSTEPPTCSEALSKSNYINREWQFKYQQRWLLFLLHARRCAAPEGKCQEPNCIIVQRLLTHIECCKVFQCTFPRCHVTKGLIMHHRCCKNTSCPVCIPVKNFVQTRLKALCSDVSSVLHRSVNGSYKTQETSEIPGKLIPKASSGIAKNAKEIQSLPKRMKVEQESQSSVALLSATSEPPFQTAQHSEQSDDSHTQAKFEVSGKKQSNLNTVEMKNEHMDEICIKKPDTYSIPGGFVGEEDVKVERAMKIEKDMGQSEPKSSTIPIEKESKSGKSKAKGVSLTELFTPEQVRQHIRSLRQWVGQSKAKAEKNQAIEHSMSESSCQLCAVEKLKFEPPPIYCTPCGVRIKRNAMYYTVGTGETRHCFCIPCYNGTRGGTIVDGSSIPKARVEKKKNDEESEEWWVQCDKCEAWQHQICALFNGRRNDGGQAEYSCPNCYLAEVERGERNPLPQNAVLGAKDLPRTILSDHMEQRLFSRLKHERQDRAMLQGKAYEEVPGAESLVVRVVSSVDRKLEVKSRFFEIFQEQNYPTEFPYKSKVILLFQNIEGVEVCLFGMYVQEFGSECQQPNHRRVYLSYLDSVKYFRPDVKAVTGEALRTFVYHEILIGYLDYCKKRGFTSCYIWACPPLKGEDYILYCHPEIQKTPKSDKLREWYLSMLKKAEKENIVVGLTNLYEHFFVTTGESKAKVTAARLPYFDGDYWPGAAEDIIYQLQQENDGSKQHKKGMIKKTITKRALKASGQTDLSSNASKDLLLMHKLGETISPMREDFIMVHLQHACSYCCILMISGNRWVCKQCKKFQLCENCYDTEQGREDRERHPVNHKDKHALYPVPITDVTNDTKDEDEILESEFFDTRQAFLTLCQGNHYQYDTLRRAKHSSMMVLYHLHNPTAPAFVATCYVCHLEIEAGQGWHCETCSDFDVCNSCYHKDGGIDHLHKLTNNPSNDHDAQNKEARELRVMQLRKMLDLLVHASQCRLSRCQYSNCRKVKGLFRHGMLCKIRVSGGCVLCKKMWYLLQLHARACKESACHVPRCRDLKEHMRRLQQQSDSRRRAAVMEMMRQRAAEVAGSS